MAEKTLAYSHCVTRLVKQSGFWNLGGTFAKEGGTEKLKEGRRRLQTEGKGILEKIKKKLVSWQTGSH